MGILTIQLAAFQSTLPRGSDGEPYHFQVRLIEISIHAPSWERRCHRGILHVQIYFNPRSLVGATNQHPAISIVANISIHAPSWERQSVPLIAHLA